MNRSSRRVAGWCLRLGSAALWIALLSAAPAAAATASPETGFDQKVQAAPVRAYLGTHADTFGGEYIDRSTPDAPRWVVEFTADVSQRRLELSRLFAEPSAMEVRQVSNTWQSLLGLSRRVGQDEARINAQGVDLLTWGPDPRVNRLVLRLRTVDDHATTLLSSLYPAQLISIVQGSGSTAVNGSTAAPKMSDDRAALWALAASAATLVVAAAAATWWRRRRRLPTA